MLPSGGLQRTSSKRVVTSCFPSAMCCILVVCLARNVNSSCLFASSLRNCCQLPSKLVFHSTLCLIPFPRHFLFQTSGCFQGTGPKLYPPCLLAPAAFNIWQEDLCCVVINYLAINWLQHINKRSTIEDDHVTATLNTANEAIKRI